MNEIPVLCENMGRGFALLMSILKRIAEKVNDIYIKQADAMHSIETNRRNML